MRLSVFRLFPVFALLLALLPGVHSTHAQIAPVIQPERLFVQVLEKRPHDPTSFTEGFELVNGKLYESAGLYGQSSIRLEDAHTGAVIRQVDLAPKYFGEGIAIVGNRLIQLTWKERTAFVYDANTFALLNTLPYDDDGWGMCYDGQQLYTDDGSTTIDVRDPQTLAVTRQIPVDEAGAPVLNLNELECVGDSLYANIWQTDTIVRIDKASGHVTAVIDASGLLTPDETQAIFSQGGVLNGIAYDPQANTFLITGKLWPWMFVVRFVAPVYF